MVNQELERSSNSQKDKSMQKITKEDLLNSGAHFGHVSSKTDPNFKDFVVSQKNGIDIINLDDTLEGLDKALNFISNIVQRNGEILFVGTKKHAKDVIDPKFGELIPSIKEEFVDPIAELGPHVAPLGMVFYDNNKFPDK